MPTRAAPPDLDRTRRILEKLFGSPAGRDFSVRFWTGDTEGPTGAPFTLVLGWPGALRSMLLPPTERSLGEAYVFGDCDVEGDLELVVATVEPVLREPVVSVRAGEAGGGAPRASLDPGGAPRGRHAVPHRATPRKPVEAR